MCFFLSRKGHFLFVLAVTDFLHFYFPLVRELAPFAQIRPANDQLTGGHARGHPHWGGAGRSTRSEAVAIRRILARR